MRKKIRIDVNSIEVRNLVIATTKSIQVLNRYQTKKLKIPLSFFLDIHSFLLAHENRYAGRYRKTTDHIHINRATFLPVEQWQIEFKITELIEFINNKRKWRQKYNLLVLKKINYKDRGKFNQLGKTDIFLKIFISWYVHHMFTIIHPFCDGNGRMARLLMCLVLRNVGLSHYSFPALVNTIIDNNKKQYIDALNKADKSDYVSGMVYMMKVLKQAYNITQRVIKKTDSK